mgnify:CR=1 FL=1
MNQKEAVHERLKEYACVAPDQMMQKLQINAEGLRRKRQSSGDRNMEIMRRLQRIRIRCFIVFEELL